MACIPFPSTLGLEQKPFILGIHNVKHRIPVVKLAGQCFLKGIINIFDIKCPNLFFTFKHRRLHRIGPGSHIIKIGNRNRQPIHCLPPGKIQAFFGKYLTCIWKTLCFSRKNHGYLDQGFIFLIRADKTLQIFKHHCFLGNQLLKLRFLL